MRPNKNNSITRNDVIAMLSFVPSEDREVWITVGMAINSEIADEEGFDLFDEWSSKASNYDPKAVRPTWKSFQGDAIGIASLIHIAKQHGWRPGKSDVAKKTRKPMSSPVKRRDTSAYAKKLFLAANRNDQYVGSHPYTRSKGIPLAAGAGRGSATGRLIGKKADCIIVPIRNIHTGRVQGVECINNNGKKQTFGKKSGGALILGNTLNRKEPWYILEGWASCVSTVFHHNKQVAVCAFGKSSQDSVARAIAKRYSPDEIVILREVDA